LVILSWNLAVIAIKFRQPQGCRSFHKKIAVIWVCSLDVALRIEAT